MSDNNDLQKAWEETGKADFLLAIKDSEEESLNELIVSKYQNLWKSAYDENKKKERVLICADERVMPLPGEFKVGTAGQLILDSPKYLDSFVNSFKGKIKAVRSHSGCGAAGIAYSKLSEEDKNSFLKNIKNSIVIPSDDGGGVEARPTGLSSGRESLSNSKRDPFDCALRAEFTLAQAGAQGDKIVQDDNGIVGILKPADLYGAYHSYDLAMKMGVKFEHIPFVGMRGYKEFHDARIIFWSADPSFDPSTLTDKFFPPHFLSNGLAFGVNEDYCKEELKILSNIALGDHGFGKLFNGDSPFYVISVGKNLEEAKKMNEWAKETMKEFGNRVDYKYLGSQEI